MRPVMPTYAPRAAPVLPLRLASLVAAQMFDYGTFTVMVGRHGISPEANPLVAIAFAAFGMPVLALAKAALVVLVASIIVILSRDRPLRRRAPDLAGLVAVLAVVGGLIGGVSNVLAG